MTPHSQQNLFNNCEVDLANQRGKTPWAALHSCFSLCPHFKPDDGKMTLIWPLCSCTWCRAGLLSPRREVGYIGQAQQLNITDVRLLALKRYLHYKIFTLIYSSWWSMTEETKPLHDTLQFGTWWLLLVIEKEANCMTLFPKQTEAKALKLLYYLCYSVLHEIQTVNFRLVVIQK